VVVTRGETTTVGLELNDDPDPQPPAYHLRVAPVVGVILTFSVVELPTHIAEGVAVGLVGVIGVG
jgi:hypothetical protein